MEAAKLRKLNSILFTGMENAGWVKLNRDQAGEITGLIIDLSGSGGGEASGGATLNVQPSAATPDPEIRGRSCDVQHVLEVLPAQTPLAPEFAESYSHSVQIALYLDQLWA